MPSAILDNSAYARIRLDPPVRDAVLAYLDRPLATLRTVLVQRREICVSARNVREFDRTVASLAAMPLLPDATEEVSRASESLQRKLVHRGTHRGPKVVDLLIAATALVHDCEVLHYDQDYDLLAAAEPALRAHWIVPPGTIS